MKFLVLVFSFLFSHFVSCQTQFCGTDEMHKQLFLDHPEYNAGVERAYEKLQLHTDQYLKNKANEKSAALYVIPVVFHIIHNNGVENIHDSQIHDAMLQLNKQYRKLNADTSEIVAQFQSIAADTKIEFRLAQLDPNGNCTSGITRTVSTLGSVGNHDVKSLIHWPPNKYLNVYICIAAAGLAGHAMMPPAADTMPQWDGIVMQHSYIGTTGTSEYFRRTVLSHEVGHFLNLQHIWGGNNVPNYYYLPCGAAGNCAFDDDVIDTPNSIGYNSCNLAGNSCGTLNNVQNYMDYAYCARMFTAGQVDRMHAALNSPIAGRNNLWTQANLIATGTAGVSQFCAAKIEINKKIACVGDTLFLNDVSYHGGISRTWNVPSGVSSSLFDSSMFVIYSAPGTYKILLNATNGVQVLKDSISVRILPSTGLQMTLAENFEDSLLFDEKWVNTNQELNYDWNFSHVGFNSNQSIKANNFVNGNAVAYEFLSEPIDFSAASDLTITHDFAFAQILATNGDFYRIYTSVNCGETWQLRRTFLGLNSLQTAPAQTTPFVPTAAQWKSDTMTLVSASVLSDKLLVKFRFDCKGGNNFYIDNIQIAQRNKLNINDNFIQEFNVFPNPAMNKIKISSEFKMNSISIFDLQGKLIIESKLNENEAQIDLEQISRGIYTVFVRFENGLVEVKKLIVE
jgi:Pregnancy-associated plasma protein-A/Secretion system C-terminal sorting domain